MAGGILALPSLLQLEVLKRGLVCSAEAVWSSLDFMVALRLLRGEF